MHRYFGIIPARSGSKGIPHKNMQLIGNKPMLQYTLEAAKQSCKLDCCILTSDDPEAIALSKKVGVNTPFVRPEHLSKDNSSTSDVIKHALDWHKSEYSNYPEDIILLQPTSPFRTAGDIDDAIRKFEQSEKESLISVCHVSQHPSDCIIVNDKENIERFCLSRAESTVGRQNYQKVYFIDGGIYISGIKRFLKKKTMFDFKSEVFVIPQTHGIDIDNHFELELARAMICYNQAGNKNILNTE